MIYEPEMGKARDWFVLYEKIHFNTPLKKKTLDVGYQESH